MAISQRPEYLKTGNERCWFVSRLRERIDQQAGNLSGGEQQMLAMAMAFIAKPKLLMIDELSLGLAPTIVEQLLGIVRRIQESGTAIILVEQSINVALTVAERAYFMEKGEVRFEGSTAELLKRDDIVRSVFLEGASKTDAKKSSRTTVNAKANGHEGRTKLSIADLETRPVVLELVDVVKRFGGIRAVDEASFALHQDEILGLIGPNGGGKTTLFDLISGFLVPDQARIRFNDEDITEMRADQRAWLGLGRSFQDARLVPSLTVAENLAIGLERHIELRDHFAAFISLPGVIRMEEDVAWTVEDLVELMHLGAFRDKFVRELSTGSRRIVDLAMCIAHDPKVLLLDEPSSGIAQRETEALGPLLERIQRETGCALLVIEHDMPLITSVSDRIIALELGHPIAEGAPQDVIRDPQVLSSYSVVTWPSSPVGRAQEEGDGAAQGGGALVKRSHCGALILCSSWPRLVRRPRPSDGGRLVVARQTGAARSLRTTVPPGGFMVGGDPSGANAIAALRFELEADQGTPAMTLRVAPNGDFNGASAQLAACRVVGAWAPAFAGPWPSRPTADCATAVVGTRSEDGTAWTFNLEPFLVGNTIEIVLTPGAGSNFNLSFNPR